MGRRFKAGEVVQVRAGIACPDAPELDMSGWRGRVVDTEGGMVHLAWDSATLAQLPGWYIAEGEERGEDWAAMLLEPDSLAPAEARDTGDEARDTAAALDALHSWYAIDDIDIRAVATDRVYQRGLSYFQIGAVVALDSEPDGFVARVQGGASYRVFVRGRPDDPCPSCDCPYSGRGECKHAVAALLAIQAEGKALRARVREHQLTRPMGDPVGMPAAEALPALLRGVERPGRFYATGTEITPLPELAVDGLGPLSFPLPAEQARRLFELAEPAPYGLGPDTVHDPGVRRAWQLPPERFSVGGAPWEVTLASITRSVAAGLGAQGEVAAELYKLVLYKPEGFFLEHRDTEKAQGMFGTLVIVLPSPHSGGALVVRHAGEAITLSLSGDSPSQVSYAAFYADCPHELKPVTDGVRLALVYNLVRRGPGQLPIPPDHREVTEQVAAALERWRAALDDGEEEPGKLVYVLGHHYTATELDFAALKNADAAAASVLLEAARRARCDCHLAMLRIREAGAAESSGWGGYRGRYRDWDDEDEDEDFEVTEVLEESRTLEHWRAAFGPTPGLGTLPFEDEELSPPGVLEDVDPDEQRYMEASGNEGASFERAWRRAALVLWPAERALEVVCRGGLGAALPYLERLAERWTEGGDVAARRDACALAEGVMEEWPSHDPWSWRAAGDGEERGMLLEALARLGDPGLAAQGFLQVLIPVGYDGREDAGIAAALPLLTPAVRRVLLRQLVARHAHFGFKKFARLLARLGAPGSQPAEVLGEAAAALLAELPGAAPPREYPSWRRPDAPDAGFVVVLLTALWQIGAPGLVERALVVLLEHPERYPVDGVLLPAALSLVERSGDGVGPGFTRLVSACEAHLRARVALPLAPPTDWARDAPPGCGCEDCQSLRDFLAEPERERWRFSARQSLRSHIEDQIRRQICDLDCATERRGSPHTLICTKNQASYQRRVAQRREDERALERLRGAPGATSRSRGIGRAAPPSG